jgi:membrane-bound lytic murein transglycosylase A
MVGAGGPEGLFTGYYWPGCTARKQSESYTVPLYRPPPDLPAAEAYHARKIDGGVLAGRGLELLWLDDRSMPSSCGPRLCRVRRGRHLRSAAANNGHPPTMIGRILVERAS